MTTYEKFINNIISYDEYMSLASPSIFEIIRNESAVYTITDEDYLSCLEDSHDIREFSECYRKKICDLFGEKVNFNLLKQAYYYRFNKLKEEFELRDKARVLLDNYNCSNMFLDATSNRGLVREKNDDAVAVVNKNNATMLLVCDGVGGDELSDRASKIVIDEFVKWFRSTIINKDNITRDVNHIINTCSQLMNRYCKYGSTTLTLAITVDDKVYFYNIGDSRGYIINNNKLSQVTSDDSEVWEMYKNGQLTKDDLRFMLWNNIITDAILSKPSEKIITPQVVKDYDGIILFSDGVTDVLSDKEIESLLESSTNTSLLDDIITNANFSKMESPIETEENYMLELKSTRPGWDNQSIAYLKKLIK